MRRNYRRELPPSALPDEESLAFDIAHCEQHLGLIIEDQDSEPQTYDHIIVTGRVRWPESHKKCLVHASVGRRKAIELIPEEWSSARDSREHDVEEERGESCADLRYKGVGGVRFSAKDRVHNEDILFVDVQADEKLFDRVSAMLLHAKTHPAWQLIFHCAVVGLRSWTREGYLVITTYKVSAFHGEDPVACARTGSPLP